MNMSKDIFNASAKYFGNKTINIVGPGEPFLHPNIFGFIEICQSRNAGVHIVTNGSLLTKHKSKQLLEYTNLQSIAFSIDATGENYNKIRVNGHFSAVIDNLRQFHELKKNMKLNFPLLTINFVGMRSNVDEFPKLLNLAGEYINTMQLIHPIAFTPEMADDHLNNYPEYAQSIFNQSILIAQKYNVKLILPNLFPRARKCIYPWTLPYIGLTGNVYPCHMFGGGDQRDPITAYYGSKSVSCDPEKNIIGNITDFDKIWNNQKMTQFRKNLSKININNSKNTYLETMTKWSHHDPYCKACPSRWDCAC
jgi:MoaA/NifB/PqqE/SkfB family radical SAM enzyme